MKVYTRTGDAGLTSLGDGSRVSKAARRVDAYGTVDELNTVVGILLAEALPEEAAAGLRRVQSLLFEVGAFLASPGGSTHLAEEIREPGWLERWIDAMDDELPALRSFVLPAGSRAAALTHQARTVCRRAERAVVRAGGEAREAATVVPFLNRLSDTLFTLARFLNHRAGVPEVVWQPRASTESMGC